MNSIHFEQFVEEVWQQFPAASTIAATESPLQVLIDGQSFNPQAHINRHSPFYLRAEPERIRANGIDYTTIRVESVKEANREVTLAILQGETILHQSVEMDTSGKGYLEICTQTEGDILVFHPMLPVRVLVSVQPI